jgi:hypothetical protein
VVNVMHTFLSPPSSPPGPTADVRVQLVSFRSGESIADHPELASWLERGWTVRSARPRTTRDGAKLLVVLTNGSAWAPEAQPEALVHERTVLPPPRAARPPVDRGAAAPRRHRARSSD